MSIYVCEAICDVCGEPGAATLRTATVAWMPGSFVSHKDPRVCAENLKEKRKREEQERSYQKRCALIR